MTEFVAGPLPAGMKPTPNGDKPAGVMTKREHIAAMAMQGLLHYGVGWQEASERLAVRALEITDALLSRLEPP